MGVEKCDIFYDNPASTYYEGQTVNGRVEFTFDSSKKFRGIRIEFIGESNVFWQESHERKGRDGRDETYQEHYNAYEQYFKVQYFLYGSASSGEYELGAGKHAFPFTCALPPGLPTSFEGENGYVRYTIKVTIVRPWKFDHEYKFAFTVLSVYDLNANPKLKQEVNDLTSETFCCCCCQSGPFNMNVHLPCTGFVPGQTIPISIDCDNASSTKIEYIAISLDKIENYHADNPHKKTKSRTLTVKNIATDSLEPGEQATFCEELTVPPLPPSDLTNCSIIDIDYRLHIKAKVGGCSSSPYTTIYIQIGTVPIHEMVDELVPNDTISEPGSEKGEKVTEPLNPGGIGWNSQQGYPPASNGYPPVTYPPQGGTPNPYQPTIYPPQGTPNPYQPTTYPSGTPFQQTGYPPAEATPYPPATQYHPPTAYPANPPYPSQQYGQPTQGYPISPPVQGAPYPVGPASQEMQQQPAYNFGPSPAVTLPANIPPPTYAESQFRATSIQTRTDSEHVNVGTQNFAPRYPVYNLPPSAPPAP